LGTGRGEGIPGLKKGERAAWAARHPGIEGNSPARTEPFSGRGQRLGEGDGTGTGIPGLDKEAREKAQAERERRETAPTAGTRPVKPRTPPRKPVTLDDIRENEPDTTDRATSAGDTGGPIQTRSGNGTVTLLEQPTNPESKAPESKAPEPKAPEPKK